MIITSFFTKELAPAIGLSPTIRIRDVSDNSLVVTDAVMTEVGDGWYKYDFTTYDIEKDYAIRCDGTVTLTGSERYTFAGNDSFVDDIWNALTANHAVVGSTSVAVTDGASGGNPGGLSIDTHSVSEFFLGQTGTLAIAVLNQGSPVTGLTPTADIYNPDDTAFLTAQSFTEIGTTGYYTLDFSIPTAAQEGVYVAQVKATQSTTGVVSTDDFEDGDITNWSTFGGAIWSAVNEGAPQNFIINSTASAGSNFATSDAAGNQLDFTYIAKVKIEAGNFAGLTFRFADTLTRYEFYMRNFTGSGSDNVRLRKNGATLQQTAGGSITLNNQTWYTLKVEMIGGLIKCYVDNVLQITHTDSTPLASGKVGFFMFNISLRGDDVNVTPISALTTVHISKDFKVDDSIKKNTDKALSVAKFLGLK